MPANQSDNQLIFEAYRNMQKYQFINPDKERFKIMALSLREAVIKYLSPLSDVKLPNDAFIEKDLMHEVQLGEDTEIILPDGKKTYFNYADDSQEDPPRIYYWFNNQHTAWLPGTMIEGPNAPEILVKQDENRAKSQGRNPFGKKQTDAEQKIKQFRDSIRNRKK